MSKDTQTRVPVLHFTNSTVWGGVEGHICGLLQNLSRNIFRSHLVCDPMIFDRFRAALPTDVEVTALPLSSPTHAISAVRLARLMRRERFRIVHSHMFWSSLFASPVASGCGVPVILETLHGTEAWRKGWKASNAIDRTINQFVSKHVAVCESDARFLAEKKHVPANKIETIHNGIDIRKIAVSDDRRHAIRHAIGAKDSDCVLVTVARFHKGKGHRVLLEAMRELGVQHPQAKLVLLGEGEEQADMRSLCKNLGITEKVRFAGFQPNVGEWLSAADVNVLPTFYEGFPLTILEAMAAGLPTVASNVGGIPEAIEDRVSGLLVPAGDPQTLAATISSLISNAEARLRMGTAARERVSQLFTFERQVQVTENLYLTLLGDSSIKENVRPIPGFVPRKEWPSSADAN